MQATRKDGPYARGQRVDAYDKVRGVTRYAADDARPGLLHAALVTSSIARGRVLRINASEANQVRGIQLVLTYENVGALNGAGFLLTGTGFGFQSAFPLRSADIAHRGQIVAMVVADTLEAAREGAMLITVDYGPMPFVATIFSPGAQPVPQSSVLPVPSLTVGDADAAIARAGAKVASSYKLPAQHQNPMELIATVAQWEGGVLTIHEPTQNAECVRHGVAQQLGIDPANVRVNSPSVGGGFGQKNSLQSQTALVAIAARMLARPVKLVVPRTTIFQTASFRPAANHRVQLGADRSGQLLGAVHEIDQQTSRHDYFPSTGTEMTSRLYGARNFRGTHRLIATDTQTPGYMRAPSEHPAAFAFECTMDELAYQLGMDPVALRLANDTATDPITGKPFSSRYVAECLTRGAQMFGWSRRSMAPGSMRAPDGTLVGWGMALGAYTAGVAPAMASVRIELSGRVRAAVGVHEMGQGIRTAIALTLARELGAPLESIDIEIGDTRAAPQHLTAGSWGSATALPPIKEAASKLMEDLRKNAGGNRSGSALELLRASGRSFAQAESAMFAPGQPEQVLQRLMAGLPSPGGPEYPNFVSFSFIAHFVEVRIEPRIGRIRVARSVSVADCGTVVSPRTARSQMEGGVVWGIGAALREISGSDSRYGGFLNADLADYVVPVAADIGRIEVDFVNKPDTQLNALGVKGLGEVVMVGVAPAIVNAVFHATGKRIRELPVRIEDMVLSA